MRLPEKDYRANCISEIKPGVILVGLDEGRSRSMVAIHWETQKIDAISGPDGSIIEVVTRPDGRVFAASLIGLYEKVSPGQN